VDSISDVIVVGGGPCGSFAALNLARLGANVVVFEEHDEIGVPTYCTGHLSIKGLRSLGQYPLSKDMVENTFCGADFYSPSGKKFSVRLASPITCVINRKLFDKHIADLSEEAGVRFCLGSRVGSLIIEDGFAKGVAVEHNGRTESFRAKLVIDAEGISSRLLIQAGLVSPDRHMLVNGVQAEVEGIKDVEEDTVEVFLGREYAPGFYAWLVPKHEGRGKVGLASNAGNPRELLKKLVTKHPVASRKLSEARVLRMAFHPITLGGPVVQPYSKGFLVVGDAASQVKPTTGGGVVFGMTCARIAAKVAWEAICKNDFSSRSLSQYNRRCREALGFDVKLMLPIRRALNSMSDRRLDDIIEMCVKLGLEKTLQHVEDIDFQGRSLTRALYSPRLLGILAYFFYAYLAANP
jgi:digeranylgeranylglycerophospholipid reductase